MSVAHLVLTPSSHVDRLLASGEEEGGTDSDQKDITTTTSNDDDECDGIDVSVAMNPTNYNRIAGHHHRSMAIETDQQQRQQQQQQQTDESERLLLCNETLETDPLLCRETFPKPSSSDSSSARLLCDEVFPLPLPRPRLASSTPAPASVVGTRPKIATTTAVMRSDLFKERPSNSQTNVWNRHTNVRSSEEDTPNGATWCSEQRLICCETFPHPPSPPSSTGTTTTKATTPIIASLYPKPIMVEQTAQRTSVTEERSTIALRNTEPQHTKDGKANDEGRDPDDRLLLCNEVFQSPPPRPSKDVNTIIHPNQDGARSLVSSSGAQDENDTVVVAKEEEEPDSTTEDGLICDEVFPPPHPRPPSLPPLLSTGTTTVVPGVPYKHTSEQPFGSRTQFFEQIIPIVTTPSINTTTTGTDTTTASPSLPPSDKHPTTTVNTTKTVTTKPVPPLLALLAAAPYVESQTTDGTTKTTGSIGGNGGKDETAAGGVVTGPLPLPRTVSEKRRRSVSPLNASSSSITTTSTIPTRTTATTAISPPKTRTTATTTTTTTKTMTKSTMPTITNTTTETETGDVAMSQAKKRRPTEPTTNTNTNTTTTTTNDTTNTTIEGEQPVSQPQNSRYLAYSWDALGLGQHGIGSIGLDEYLDRVYREGGGVGKRCRSRISSSGGRRAVQVMDSLRPRTVLPPPGSELYEVVRTRYKPPTTTQGFEDDDSIPKDPQSKTTNRGPQRILSTSISPTLMNNGTDACSNRPSPPSKPAPSPAPAPAPAPSPAPLPSPLKLLPLEHLQNLFTLLQDQDQDDGVFAAVRRTTNHMTAENCVDHLRSIENTVFEYKLRQEKLERERQELGLGLWTKDRGSDSGSGSGSSKNNKESVI